MKVKKLEKSFRLKEEKSGKRRRREKKEKFKFEQLN